MTKMKKEKEMLDVIVDIRKDTDIIDLWNLYQELEGMGNLMPDDIPDPFMFKPLLNGLNEFAEWVEKNKHRHLVQYLTRTGR